MMSLLLAGVVVLAAPGFQVVRIMATADLHCRMLPTVDFDSPGVPRRLLGGWAGLAHVVGSNRTPASLLLDCGDFAYGSPEGDSSHGRLAVEFMNALGYDAAAVGARDFAGGAQNLEVLAGQARFPLLADPMLDVVLNQRVPLFRPYVVKRIDDIRIGLVGLTDPDIARLNTLENTRGLAADPPAVQLSRYLPSLRAEGVDLVVALGHVSPRTGAELLDSFPELDLLLCPTARVAGTPAVAGDRFVQVGAYGQRLACVDILVNLEARRADAVQAKHLNVIPGQGEDSAVAAVVTAALLSGQDSAATAAPVEFGPDEDGMVLLGSTVAEAARQQAGVSIAVLPVETVESGLAEGVLTRRALHMAVPFPERLRLCSMDDTTLHKLVSGTADNEPAPFLAGAGYFVIGDTTRWPTGGMVARIRVAGLRPPYSVVTTENLLEKAGLGREGRLLPVNLTGLWMSWATSRDSLGPVRRPRVYPATAGIAPVQESVPFPININTATASLLEQLPGIGPKTAGRIVEYRAVHGRFGSVDELLNVKGIGPKRLEAVRHLVTVR